MRSHVKVSSAGSKLRRSGAARLALLCVPALLIAALFAAPAQAAPETIAEFGDDAGKVNLPVGAAVDRSSGDVYIADANNNRIDKFDSDGNFLLAWGFGVADGVTPGLQTCGPQATPPTSKCFGPNLSSGGAGNVNPAAVAVDQSSGAVYVADRLRQRVSKFSSSGEFLLMVGRNVNETKVADGGATQAEKNICTTASGDTCGSGETGTGPNEFTNSISAVAVDSAGIVWVGDENRLTSFDATGTAGAEIAMPGAGFTQSLALDSADNFYVISQFLPGVRKLEAGTGALLETLDEAGQPRTVALDEDDNVYVGDTTSPYRFKLYNPAGEQTAEFGAGQVIGAPGASNVLGGNGLAVDEDAGKLYSASSESTESDSVVQAFPLPEPGPLVVSQGVEDVLPTTAMLTAQINPEGDETTYRFEYGTTDNGTTDSYGQSTPTQTLPAGFETEAVEADLEELIPDTTYHFRVVATNHCNPSEPAEVCAAEGEDQTFTTPPAVAIEAQWATDITATSAILHAELDPLGVEAEAWLEWGTSESYGQTVPLANLGDGFGAVIRQASLLGLQPGTTYHYRFVARDVRDGNPYTVPGADKTFTTQVSALGFELADNRAWEMVSPPDKHGARMSGGFETHIQASADGNGLAYQSLLSTEAEPEGNRFLEPSMNLARRGAEGSWRSKDITPPNDRVSGVTIGNGSEYKLFSADLSEALLEPRSGTPLSHEASERTPYLRENTEPHLFRPLVTGKEGFANVPPGTEFGGDNSLGTVRLAGVSPDFKHAALVSNVPLVEGAPASPTLYEWSDGQLEPVSVLPPDEGGAIVNAFFVGSGEGSVRGAVSEDGSRVFWSTGSLFNGFTALYVRDTEADESARLDVVQSGPGVGTARPTFQGASADGSAVFFTDSRQLTEDASANGFDLYRCELAPGSIASGCATLTDISVPTTVGEDAEVQDIAAAIGSDGETIYFVAKGVLDEAANEAGEGAVPGEPNLYVWSEGEGLRFIATLHPVKDRGNWGEFDTTVNGMASGLSATASPSGRYLVFMSQRSLTGHDSRDATTGEPAQEVFRYDALAERLDCVSCNPTGASPDSATPSQVYGSLVDPAFLWGDLRAAATLPQAVSISLRGPSFYRPRAALDNGRVFFNAIDSLVPADSNAQWDVYQHEPTGVGDCAASSGGAAISRSAGGCVSLISSGTAEEEAGFLDASLSGDDAFFWTPAQLNETDSDHEVDVYDARVNGIPATLPQINECLGEACQPAARVPDDSTPASAAFRGQGNAKPPARKRCAKGKRAVRRGGKSRCILRKQKRQSAKRRANRNRGARR